MQFGFELVIKGKVVVLEIDPVLQIFPFFYSIARYVSLLKIVPPTTIDYLNL